VLIKIEIDQSHQRIAIFCGPTTPHSDALSLQSDRSVESRTGDFGWTRVEALPFFPVMQPHGYDLWHWSRSLHLSLLCLRDTRNRPPLPQMLSLQRGFLGYPSCWRCECDKVVAVPFMTPWRRITEITPSGCNITVTVRWSTEIIRRPEHLSLMLEQRHR
jgi:hypothetical protein